MLGLELHEAAASGDYDTLEELLRSGKIDVNTVDEDLGNKTALHWSCQKGFVECSRLLLDYGAKGTARTLSGWTPAHVAAESGRVAVLRALHAANIATDKPDNYGCRPSRVAEIYDHHDSIRFLKQAEIELIEKRERFELVDLSEDEEDQNSSNVNFEEPVEKEIKNSKEKVSKDKVLKEKVSKDKKSKEKVSKNDMSKDKVSKDKVSKDKVPKEKMTKDKVANKKK